MLSVYEKSFELYNANAEYKSFTQQRDIIIIMIADELNAERLRRAMIETRGTLLRDQK